MSTEKSRNVTIFKREVDRLEKLVAARKRKVERGERKLADAQQRLKLARAGKL